MNVLLRPFLRTAGVLAVLGTVSLGLRAQIPFEKIVDNPAVVVLGGSGGHGGDRSGGGNGRGGGDGTGPATLPVITLQPASRQIAVGANVTFAVAVEGKFPNYHWFKNGELIYGAENATLTLEKITSSNAGTYTVTITNGAGTVTSVGAVLTVVPPLVPEAPVIVTRPVAQSADYGGEAVFTVTASGTAPLAYQWQKDGVAISGATTSTLRITNATDAASYRVVVTNAVGSVVSAAAALAVSPVPIGGTYFGTNPGNGGSFALVLRGDRTGVFLGFAGSPRVALFSRNILVSTERTFAGDAGEYRITGMIAANGAVSGSISSLNQTFAASPASGAGPTSALAGFYPTKMIAGSGLGYAVIGPAGQALVVNIAGATVDGGLGTVSADGTLSVVSAAQAQIAGTVSATTAILSLTVSAGNGPVVTFVGANEARPGFARLGNIATRSQIGPATSSVIAGFVVTGSQPRPVLIRAVGPTLAAFGVTGALNAARLEVFRGETSLAVGNDWGAPTAGAASAAAIAAAALRVGAFPLASNSRDAALLLDLAPGAYTAVASGQGGAGGISLVEVYDASDAAIPGDQRIVNTATRAFAGTGDGALITGFVITGTVPKRVLIRGVGPSLAAFGVAGALARPSLTVSSGATVLATNAGWSTSPDAAAIAAGAAAAGAFPFSAGGQDAAVVINLAPGAYTAQVAGVGNATGIALVELYDLP